MKGRPIDQIVYEKIFPRPRPSDPRSFNVFLHQCLILEVRCEVHSFYGHLDTHEAKYPGLDYCNPHHRNRLSRWQWHRRLFRAFDALGLTKSEIKELTKWEGTRWAKERYESEQRVQILDTAADHMEVWTSGSGSRPPPINTSSSLAHSATRSRRIGPGHVDRTPSFNQRRPPLAANADISPDLSNGPITPMPPLPSMNSQHHTGPPAFNSTAATALRDRAHTGGHDAEDTDEELESIGMALNERLRTQAARREAGDSTAVMDEEWEQWFKQAMESGSLTALLDAARDASMPDQIRDMLRCLLDPEASPHRSANRNTVSSHQHQHHQHQHQQQQQQLRQQQLQHVASLRSNRDPRRLSLRTDLNARRSSAAATPWNNHAIVYRNFNFRPPVPVTARAPGAHGA